jgi:hypothetical protein
LDSLISQQSGHKATSFQSLSSRHSIHHRLFNPTLMSSMTIGPSYNSTAPFLARSPLTPNMSDVRSETGYSPSPKFTATDATLKAVIMRDSQLMTPPFSPAKVGDVVLPRSGDDSLAFYLSKTGVDGPLFPDDVSAIPSATSLLTPTKTRYVDIAQGRGIKRKLIEDTDDSAPKRFMAGIGTGEWFVARYTQHADVKRYLEAEIARIGRMKLFKPRTIIAIPAPEMPFKRSHKRGSSGNIKRIRTIPPPRSPRVRGSVESSANTRGNGPLDSVIEVRQIKTPRPRSAPKIVDPNAPPKVSKGQRTDAEFEDALVATAAAIYYPPNDNLDRLGPNAMKVEWKSSKKFYSPQESTRFQNLKDVKFHSKEIDLAGTINMVHFAQYEESKRLIFQFWYERKSKGLNFTKTHAQQAAHVDVNKASALWTAFDKVNWFSDEAYRLVRDKKKSWYA